jgi:alpha,alpha-trehalase
VRLGVERFGFDRAGFYNGAKIYSTSAMREQIRRAPRSIISKRWTRLALLALLSFALAATGASFPQPQVAANGLEPIRNYIATGWDRLTRSLDNCETFADPKLAGHPTLYLPYDYPETAAVKQLPAKCGVQVAHLPRVIHGPGEIDPAQINPSGLIYLPNKYVVPGGRFNEMYGWDSYFIVRGLIEDGRIDLARGMVDNLLFEVAYYGSVLNANRTYYLTRSQPPFLAAMILALNDAERKAGHEDREWLYRAMADEKRNDQLWSRGEHLAGETGLSRYYDFGEGPAPESIQDESGYYAKVAGFFLSHPELDHGYVVRSSTEQPANRDIGPAYDVATCDSAHKERRGCDPSGHVRLAAEYYKADRAMRESGFDISFRFGPYGAETDHFAPVCLNSLIYAEEMDAAQIDESLGRKDAATGFRQAAAERKTRIQKYLWDAQRGMYFDYNFTTKTRSAYEYLTTFYPLWAGLATPEQARAVDANLKLFEQPGGLAMSRNESGVQWDYPYEWAPTVLIAVEGLRRYGFNDDANRISYEFLSTVAENFRRDGTIREKYNAVTRSSEAAVRAGYKENVVGFGWTNGVFLCLLRALPQEMSDRLAKSE